MLSLLTTGSRWEDSEYKPLCSILFREVNISGAENPKQKICHDHSLGGDEAGGHPLGETGKMFFSLMLPKNEIFSSVQSYKHAWMETWFPEESCVCNVFICIKVCIKNPL